MSTQKPVKGADLDYHMYITIGLREHFIVNLVPVRVLRDGALHPQLGQTLVAVLNDDETAWFIVENDQDYMVRDDG